ncbi:MAG: PD-(D/E)XK nuclease family protein [Bacteroidales bacterium]|nr:PD-(D/E)XK nuclease family protein [Bacteroidales bacterium]
MEYFLESIARSLHSEFGRNLSRHCLVFPSRRAGLYFLKYLSSEIEKPVWAPSVLTINELFQSFSTLQIAGNETLLFELYRVYRRIRKTPESFDDFYFWGGMLINDFDDIDKYLVDASQLFRNVLDIKNIDQQFGQLEPEHIEVIKQFWVNFDPSRLTGEKQEFLSVWGVLEDIYTSFRIALREKRIAYEGMIFRDLAEGVPDGSLLQKWDLLHFIGFNAVNRCEKRVMQWLRSEGKARFYWDFDNSFIHGEKYGSAGRFIRQNLKTLANDMPPGWSHDTLLSDSNTVTTRRAIETSSDVAQVKLIPRLLTEITDLTPENAHHTAVILPDENLLIPLLSSLPETIGDINITMGYPLRQTQIYSMVTALLRLQKNSRITGNRIFFSYRDVLTLSKHVLADNLMDKADIERINGIITANLIWIEEDFFTFSERVRKVFRKAPTPDLLSAYLKEILSEISLSGATETARSANATMQRNIDNEFIYRIILSLNRLDSIITGGEIDFTIDTYAAILDTILRSQSVPFSGEPLSGVQIMGLLETRALDFKNLIILSVNEGILPGASPGLSFIPFSLRESFGLPEISHHESVYAYHFFRLLQRSENVTFIFNSNQEGLRSGEMSRYLLQMRFDPALNPEFITLRSEIRSHGAVRESLKRTEEHSALLESQYCNPEKERLLSPTAINTWLNCRMRFYYRYVNRLKEPEVISEEIDPAMLGTIFHEVMKTLYDGFRNRVIDAGVINRILSDRDELFAVINRTIEQNFRSGRSNFITGSELLAADILMFYISRILSLDSEYAPFTLLGIEEYFSFRVSFDSDGEAKTIVAGGKIDRIDSKDGVVRIVDYKTGAVAESISSVDALFEDDREKEFDAWLQTLLYCEAYQSVKPGVIVSPSVYRVRKAGEAFMSDRLRIRADRGIESVLDDYSIAKDSFLSGLKITLGKIFGRGEIFKMTENPVKCGYCPYARLCQR